MSSRSQKPTYPCGISQNTKEKEKKHITQNTIQELENNSRDISYYFADTPQAMQPPNTEKKEIPKPHTSSKNPSIFDTHTMHTRVKN